MMYDELVKALREHSKRDNCNCDTCFAYDAEMRGYTTCSKELTEKAADTIEELQARVKESDDWWAMAKTLVDMVAPKWIPVTERLPENKRETYLVLIDGGYECDARWTDNVYGLGQSDRWGWCIFDIPQYSKVTHWMRRIPLPEPPKEEA